MKKVKVKRVEFFPLAWILVVLFNFCHIISFVSASASASLHVPKPDPAPVSISIRKCDPDSFNSKGEVEQFNKAFGYLNGTLIWTFNFNYSLNGFKNRSKIQIQTVNIQIANPNSTSVPMAENEKGKINAKPKFWRHGFFTYKSKFFINPENYCVKNMNEHILTVEICESASNSNSTSNSNSNQDSNGPNFPPTLQKCCGTQKFLTITRTSSVKCDKSEDPPWKPEIMETMKIYPNYNNSRPPCPKFMFLFPHQLAPKIKRDQNSPIKFKDIRVLESGQVETRESGNHQWKKLEKKIYCIDGYKNQLRGDQITDQVSAYDFMVLQCPPEESEFGEIKENIFAAACFISSFVLLIIVIIYALIWKQQNIHEWTKCAFSLAMFFWNICTGVRIVYKRDGEGDGFCVFIAVASHFFRVSVFAWMFLMNFDLWSTISSMRAVSQRSTERKRFLWYCFVAMTIPTIVVSTSLIIENQFSLFDDSVIRPQYGRERCSLDHTAVKAYAIYPTLILFLPNFIFIFLTLKIVWDLKKGRKKLQGAKQTTAQKDNNMEMKLCLKLFVIMGVSWTFDIISGLLETGEVSWYWTVTDIYNAAQPFLFFWLFIYKRTIREKLSEKHSLFKAGFKWADVHLPFLSSATGSGTETTTESQSQTLATKTLGVASHEGKSSAFDSTADSEPQA